jgi:hypothetical protein
MNTGPVSRAFHRARLGNAAQMCCAQTRQPGRGGRNSITVALLLATVCLNSASACDLCAIYAAAQAHGETGQGPFAGVAEQFTHFGTLQFEGEEVSNPADQHLDSSVTQLFGGYNFNDRIGLQLNLPVIYRSFRRPNELGGIDSGTESGIGDLSLLGNVLAYSRQKKHSTVLLNLQGGMKFPTGDTSRLQEEFYEVEDPIGPPSGIHGHDLTLGTGSFDGVIGGSLFARSGKFFMNGVVQYAIRTTGDYDYLFANDLTWAGGPGAFLLLRDELTLSLAALVSGETKGRDTFQGTTAQDTGVTAVYLGPQINFTWSDKLSVHVGADLPVSVENTALQTVPDYRVRAGVTWRF